MEKKFLLNEESIKPLIKIKGSCIASDKITTMGKKIGYMYRENPTSEFDTGWRFFAGDEDEQYTNDSNNFEIYELNSMPICASMVDLYDFAKTQKQVSWKGNTIKDFIVCYDENM